jgi:hypothetical protein
LIAFDIIEGAGTLLVWIFVVATSTGVHGCDEHNIAWIVDRSYGSGDGDLLVFQWLAECIECVSGKLSEFIGKQDSSMSQ